MLLRITLLFLFFTSMLSADPQKQKYNLSICAIFNNEAPYLKEWIEYHQLLGVEHFYLYNHQSTDEYLEVLMPYINSKVVELKDWNFSAGNVWTEWQKIQVGSYNDCIKNKKKESKWIAFIDIDEFIYPVKEFTIPEFLENYEPYAGVVINWQLYGTSDIWKISPSKLMIETLVKRAQNDFPDNYQYKTILKPNLTVEAQSAHYFVFKPGYTAVNTDFIPLESIKFYDHMITTILMDKMRLVHYWTRDMCFFNQKMERYKNKMGKDIAYPKWKASKLNSVVDNCMDKYIAPLRENIFGE